MEISKIKEQYTAGTKVRLIEMNDIQAVPSGTIGTVQHVDDAGTIHVAWETGSGLGLILGEDLFEIVDKQD